MQSASVSRSEGASGLLQRSQPRAASPGAHHRSRLDEPSDADSGSCIASVIENRVKEVTEVLCAACLGRGACLL